MTEIYTKAMFFDSQQCFEEFLLNFDIGKKLWASKIWKFTENFIIIQCDKKNKMYKYKQKSMDKMWKKEWTTIW